MLTGNVSAEAPAVTGNNLQAHLLVINCKKRLRCQNRVDYRANSTKQFLKKIRNLNDICYNTDLL